MMLVACRTRLPRPSPLALACYVNAGTSALFNREDDGYHDFASAAASQQGDPFGGPGGSSPSPTALVPVRASYGAFPDLSDWDDTTRSWGLAISSLKSSNS